MADPPKAPRAMTDANVLLAGNAFPRWPYEVLQHAIDGDFKLVLCPLIVKQAREHLEERFPAHLVVEHDSIDSKLTAPAVPRTTPR